MYSLGYVIGHERAPDLSISLSRQAAPFSRPSQLRTTKESSVIARSWVLIDTSAAPAAAGNRIPRRPSTYRAHRNLLPTRRSGSCFDVAFTQFKASRTLLHHFAPGHDHVDGR